MEPTVTLMTDKTTSVLLGVDTEAASLPTTTIYQYATLMRPNKAKTAVCGSSICLLDYWGGEHWVSFLRTEWLPCWATCPLSSFICDVIINILLQIGGRKWFGYIRLLYVSLAKVMQNVNN